MIESIVRVLHANGQSVGTGFVAGNRLIVTCAHVVAGAGGGPGATVRVVPAGGGAAVPAEVEPAWWRDPKAADVAVLRCVQPLPDEVRALPLARSAGVAGRSISTFGYPAAKPDTGMWGYGSTGDLLPGEPGRMQLRDAPEVTQGYSGAPVVDRDTGRVLGMVSAITREDKFGRQSTTTFATTVDALLAICPQLAPSEENPYRSLHSFEERHARLFFGRDREIERILDRVRRQPRFLAVLGPSGSGKSSLLHAGLAARLRSGAVPGSDSWAVISTRVDADGGLTTAELAAGVPLADGLARWIEQHPGHPRCALIIDQLEELFVTVPAAARHAFLQQLTDLLGQDLPVLLVLGMRDDFYSSLARDAPELLEWVERGLVNVGATLSVAALAEIVSRPAEGAGLQFEPGLVDTIVADARGAPEPAAATGPPGAPATILPLLEFALARLWELNDGGRLTHRAYQKIGRVTGGLTQWADEAYHRLVPHERAVARRVFIDLVHLGDESQGIPDSRWRRPIAALRRPDADGDPVESVVRELTAARLLVTGRVGADETVELIHDSLLREWATLSDWLLADRRFLSWRQEIELRRQTWAATGPSGDRDEGRLLRGRDLNSAVEALAERPDDLTPAQREYIEESGQARERERQREEALRAAADAGRRLAERSEIAVSLRGDAARAVQLLAAEPVPALLLAVRTLRNNLTELPGEPLGPVQQALHATLLAATERHVFGGPTACVRTVAVSPDGALVASAGDDRTVWFWDREANLVAGPLRGHSDTVAAIAFSPDGSCLASTGGDRTVRLWGLDGTPLASFPTGHKDQVTALDFSPDGKLLLIASDDGTIQVSDLDESRVVRQERAHPEFVVTASFDSTGDRVLSAGGDGTVRLGKVQDAGGSSGVRWATGHLDYPAAACFIPGDELIVTAGRDPLVRLWAPDGQPVDTFLSGHEAGVAALACAPDGHTIVLAGVDGSVRLTDRQGQQVHEPLRGHTGPVVAVAVSPDNTFLVTGGADRTVRVWDLRVPQPPAPPAPRRARNVWDRAGCQLQPAWRGHPEWVWSVAFSPDGLRLASGSDDRTVRLWDLAGRPIGPARTEHGRAVTSVAFSPDGRLAASASGDQTVRVWRVGEQLEPLWCLEGHTDRVLAVAFSPDGTEVASGSTDGTVRRWHLGGAAGPLAVLSGHTGPVNTLAFSPDGRLLASGGDDGAVLRWSLDANPAPPPLLGHRGAVHTVSFDPAGTTLASGGADRTVRLWPLAQDAVPPPPAHGHSDEVRSVRFSPDGLLVISGSMDGTARIWDRHGDEVGQPYAGHTVGVLSVAVRPDGELIATGGADTTIRLWPGGSWRTWLDAATQRLRAHGEDVDVTRP